VKDTQGPAMPTVNTFRRDYELGGAVGTGIASCHDGVSLL